MAQKKFPAKEDTSQRPSENENRGKFKDKLTRIATALRIREPPGGPQWRSWPPLPPKDPLGVCRCWGYNFRLGNLFYYYEKT